ncbi:methyl-accepting chemotaxis protein [Desulfovibrio desulfuricans]|uniref:Methyl-accepting chemotaxis protein n=1 Tax=Desulfovibrio desulfuricans TaxID=876 RepID=A0A4P7UL25_DESDE|nr:methyl-accepting chemotaxis protein [Desulfovibrio desulfuricans]QCC86477.1 methyl-accepting chemotaxis protein [Desulfovibrio desulfuricans]
MNMTLSSRIIFVYVLSLMLACMAMFIGFNMVMGDALTGGGAFKALLIGAGLTALLAVAGSLFICNRLCPIRKCVEYARAVAAGDTKATLDMDRADCLGHLAQALRDMVAKLEGQSHWYESILDTLPLSISVTDNDMIWTFCNKAALTGMRKYCQEDVVGKHCSEKQGNICNTPQCGIEQLRRGSKQVINHMPNGKTMQIMLDFLKDKNGNTVGHVEIGEDITERIILEKKAEESAHKARMDTVNQLEGVVETLQHAANTLDTSLNDVRDKSGTVADRMAETATAMDEMNSTVLEVAHNADGAAEAATSVQGHAQEGTGIVLRTIQNMQEVQEKASGLKHEMSTLDKQARDIGAVLTLIRDIADQTNLLALNAAIEAARAGDAGRGFAVVADEVRKLAEKTMSATSEVEKAIAAIQEGTDKSSSTVDNTVTSIEEVSRMAQESGHSLDLISNLAGDSSSRVSAIATAATQQSAASEEINRNIAEVNTLSARIAEATNAATGQVRDLAEQVGIVTGILDAIRKDDRIREAKAKA